MYPYGSAHRDLETPKMDDGSSPEITLLIHFIFFNIPYRTIYVSPDQSSQTLTIEHKALKRFIAMFKASKNLCVLFTGQQQRCDLLQRAG